MDPKAPGPRSMKDIEQALVRDGGWRHQTVPWVLGRQVPTLFLCRGERILHVGCADNLGLKLSKSAERHLHTVLEATEAAVMGIDIDDDAIKQLRAMGLRTVETLDITSPEGLARAKAFKPTVILLPEVIEHIDDAGGFLRALCRIAVATKARLVLTTPNAFSGYSRHYSTSTYESVNPDHRYFFSRATLERLLESAGWHAETWWGYSYHGPPASVKRAETPEYEAFSASLRQRFPALDQILYPTTDGTLTMGPPQEAPKGRLRWLRRGSQPTFYAKPMDYDGLIVVARPFGA